MSDREMYRTFNMGVGFLIICPKNSAHRLKATIPEIQQVGYVDSSCKVIVSVAGREIEVEKW